MYSLVGLCAKADMKFQFFNLLGTFCVTVIQIFVFADFKIFGGLIFVDTYFIMILCDCRPNHVLVGAGSEYKCFFRNSQAYFSE